MTEVIGTTPSTHCRWHEESPLGAADLYRLAWSAGLTARDEEMLATTERVYRA
jgi:hypothetical protein